MEHVITFLQSITALNIFYVVLGILGSWYVSKHFAYKQPSMLVLAKRSKQTDFGNNHSLTRKNTIKTVGNDFFGKWEIHSNGTIIDTTNKLSWIQAPWGTQWNGEEFIGEPIAIPWREASNLFGTSDPISLYSKIQPADLGNISNPKKYTKGCCIVSFAGYNDWRLPTTSELATLMMDVPYNSDWEQEKKQKQEAEHIRKQLFPGLENVPDKFTVWTANTAGIGCAWVCSQMKTFDDLKVNLKYPVVLVRNIR